MSISTSILTFHPFPTDEPKKMIRQISELFQVNVYLVFESYIDLDGFADSIANYPVKNESDNKSYVIDKYIKDSSLRNITVYYDHYLYKWVLDRTEEDIPPIRAFKNTWAEDPGEVREICMSFIDDPLCFDVHFNEEGWFEISTGCADVNGLLKTDYWWPLYDMIMERNYEFLDLFLQSRENKIQLTKQLGNECLYYIPDHSHSGLGQGGYWDLTQTEIKKNLESKSTQAHTIDLRKALLDWEYYYDLRDECEGDPNYFTLIMDDLCQISAEEVIKYNTF